ncbi:MULTISPECIES: hypothetical protein [unclassified Streptomyces]|uniref:hypothetical protein n=1 Tax=unclassified Streptomyces TaxID=2593676 RepID=UPI00073BBF4E|nr:hypothetical protein [Streptomyces sp. AVP053U2]ODA75497.1 hypothetical protein APS67_000059 [Streptomyces sp. AVP053U2]
MPVIALVSAVLVLALEQYVEGKYGIIGLLLLTLGIKANSPGVSSTGAVLLALLVARPAL